jgi:DNA-binding response OmpR family regulator
MIMEPRPTALLAAYQGDADALALALSKSGFDARSHGSFASSLSDITAAAPDLVLVGDSAEGAHLQFLLDLRDLRYAGLVFLLADAADSQRVTQALEIGAHDLVAPPHSVGSILLRRLVHMRRRSQPRGWPRGDQLEHGGVTVDPATHQVIGGSDQAFTLNGRELEVLVRLMRARGEVVPREALLTDIWGDYHSEAVLDTTVHRLRRRLEAEIARPDLVATVRGVGYRLRTG